MKIGQISHRIVQLKVFYSRGGGCTTIERRKVFFGENVSPIVIRRGAVDRAAGKISVPFFDIDLGEVGCLCAKTCRRRRKNL